MPEILSTYSVNICLNVSILINRRPLLCCPRFFLYVKSSQTTYNVDALRLLRNGSADRAGQMLREVL